MTVSLCLLLCDGREPCDHSWLTFSCGNHALSEHDAFWADTYEPFSYTFLSLYGTQQRLYLYSAYFASNKQVVVVDKNFLQKHSVSASFPTQNIHGQKAKLLYSIRDCCVNRNLRIVLWRQISAKALFQLVEKF